MVNAVEGEHREVFPSDLKLHYTPEEIASELRATEQLLEGFCVAVEEIGPVALLAMNDCRERVRQARNLAAKA